MHEVYLGIGGNLGNRITNLNEVLSLISRKMGNISKISSVYLSEPWGFVHKKYFVNLVIKVNTEKSPYILLEIISEIENTLKRVRQSSNYEGRTIDIDILFFDNISINSQKLTIPHPKIQERLFVLLPFAEISENFMHFELNKTISELLYDCPDTSKIRKLNLKLNYDR